MLKEVFTKTNLLVNAFLTAIVFLGYVIFLGHAVGEAFSTSLIFFGLLFVFDWVIKLFKGRG